MRTSITIEDELMDSLLRITDSRSKSEAVREAVRRTVEQDRIEHFLKECGNSGYAADWKKQRADDAKLARDEWAR